MAIKQIRKIREFSFLEKIDWVEQFQISFI